MALFYLWTLKSPTKLKRFGYPLFAGGVPFFPFQVKKHILDTFLKSAEDGSGPPGPTRNINMSLLTPHNTCWPQGCNRRDCEEGKPQYFWMIPNSVPFILMILFYLKCPKWILEGGFCFSFKKFYTEGAAGAEVEQKTSKNSLSCQSGPNIYFHFSKSSPPSPPNHLHRLPHSQWLLPNIRVWLQCSGCVTCCFSQVLLLAELCCTNTKAKGSKALVWHWSRIHLQPQKGWHLLLHSTGSSSPGPVRLRMPKTCFYLCSTCRDTHKS